jgi:hypothetical protein
MAVSKDFGQTWSHPVTIAAPASARVLWPWAVAGDPGKVGIVWYQSSKVNDPDCAGDEVKWTIYEARLEGADNPAKMKRTILNAVGGIDIHTGGICQGGTTCVATGQDRRLGDFFTNAIDARGCEVIASGDTRITDELGQQLPTSRPIMIRQDGGDPLVGSGSCGDGAASRGDGTYDTSYVKGIQKQHRSRCVARKRAHRSATRKRTSRCTKRARRHHARRHRRSKR